MREKESAVTSSFPSRAVTCAGEYLLLITHLVVYSFFASYAYIITYEPNHVVIKWWMPVIFISIYGFINLTTLVTILLASVARVALGVHYPSDCVIGFFQVPILSMSLHIRESLYVYWELCYGEQMELGAVHVMTIAATAEKTPVNFLILFLMH